MSREERGTSLGSDLVWDLVMSFLHDGPAGSLSLGLDPVELLLRLVLHVEAGIASSAAPSGLAGQIASSAPLHFSGRCGVPPDVGVTGDGEAASTQGRHSPQKQAVLED